MHTKHYNKASNQFLNNNQDQNIILLRDTKY